MARNVRGAATLLLISSVFAVGGSAVLLRRFFQNAPPVDFADLYLLAVLGLTYRYGWQAGAILAAVSVAASGYVLSYAICASVIIWVVANVRPRHAF
jgi:hypothetical protein